MTKPTSDDEDIYEEEIQDKPGPPPVEKQAVKRTKKERSPAQQKAFEKCLDARRKRAEEQRALKAQNNDMKEEVENIVQNEETEIKPIRQSTQSKRKQRKKPIIVKEESSSSDEEPQVIYIKRKKKKKKKKKYVESDSDSDSQEEVATVDKNKEKQDKPLTKPKNDLYINKLMLMRSMGF